ncbi:MAG: hypothetical protein Q8N95_07575, partial [Desulfobacterales bacterium]|nr:hypothetical protein [Desulfobacterales bacterium]
MPVNVPDFILKLEQTRRGLNKVNSVQINSQKKRECLRALVVEYFNSVRPLLLGASEQDEYISNVDTLMQELLVLCHKRGGVKRYQTLLSKAKNGLILLDTRIVTSPSSSTDPHADNHVDTMIIQTLSQIVPSAAFSYQQALQDLYAEQRLSWRGPATDLREALRETLDYLA